MRRSGLLVLLLLIATVASVTCTSDEGPPSKSTRAPPPGEAARADSSNGTTDHVSPKFIVLRDQYDASRPFAELVKPHFFAQSGKGELVEAQGDPDLILEKEGKVKVRLKRGDQEGYLDLLALESELIGEHPVHKIFWLRAMGIPVDDGLAQKLQPANFANELFHRVKFEYLQGKETSGVVAEVFPDGTFLVIPFVVPPEWQIDKPVSEAPPETSKEALASPTHFHVNPRALSARDSSLAREYEEEILALPFEKQRYPAVPLARKQCGLYQESLQDAEYTRLLSSMGYKFTPAHLIQDGEVDHRPFGEKLSSLLREGAGEEVRYFGFDRYWVADLLTGLQVSWIGECDTAGSVRRYHLRDRDRDDFHLIVRRSLEPDKKQRYRVVKLDDTGGGQEIYTAPGIMLMALPLPWDDNFWIISAEGWPAPEEGKSADPRWQSVYIVNVNNPEEYDVVEYPISRYPRAPEEGLYGASAALSSDSRFLFNSLYGFTDEGGGLWVADLTEEGFHTKPERFARVVEWDHMLSWVLLEEETEGPSPFRSIFVTGKEVAADYAMTANFLRIKNTGFDSTLERKERLLQMVGWNPVPFAWQTLSEHRFRVAVETHFNYESSLLPRAKGVYIIPVDTTQSN